MGAMLGLHLLGLIVLLILLSGWQALTGIDGPQAFGEIPAHYLVPLAVLAAPLAEETVFRGWLSGRPRALWLLVCLIAGIAAIVLLTPVASRILAIALTLLAAGIGWVVLRKRLAPAWFARNFAAVFFASAAVFGMIHVFNYSEPGFVHVPMVLPQVWAGLTLGFLRMRVGLLAAMLVHGVSNGLALALASLAG